MLGVILYISHMPCEAGAAAVATLADNFYAVGQSISEASQADSVEKALADYPNCTDLILVGTYWNQALKTKIQPRVFLYSFGKIDVPDGPNVPRTFNGQEAGVGPVNYVIETLRELGLITECWTSLLRFNHEVLEILEDRVFGRNISKTQAFFTGLLNHPQTKCSQSNYGRIKAILKGIVDFKSVMDIGTVVFDSQLNLVRERVKTNYKQVKIDENKTVLFTEATELVNLTHVAASEIFPDVDVTATFSVRLQEDELQFSFRSVTEGTDVLPLALRVNGGGSSKSSGGRYPFKCPMPFCP